MKTKITTPVLIIAFNRPDTTEKVFERIREVQPQKLYVAIDGPRENKPGEKELCQQVVDITKNVDWHCDAKYLIREKNIGCKLGVYGAVSWALENEDRAIILEDDIVPVSTFFSFAQELLEKYKDDERIAMISASNFTPIESEEDYFFSYYGHIGGGWATWKRVWDRFDVNVPEIEASSRGGLKEFMFINEKECKYFKKYFSKLLEMIKSKIENVWGPQFVFFRRYNKLLSIVPKVNMSTNIGFVSARTDTKSTKTKTNFWYPEYDLIIKSHPKEVNHNSEYDINHFKNYINKKINLFKRAINKVMRILKLH